MKKFNELKKGDTVVVYSDNKRDEPVEYVVATIGHKKITACHPEYDRFKKSFFKENGYGEYGFYLFPGNMEEYLVFAEDKELTRKFRQEFSSMYSLHLTKDQIERIRNIINE